LISLLLFGESPNQAERIISIHSSAVCAWRENSTDTQKEEDSKQRYDRVHDQGEEPSMGIAPFKSRLIGNR